MELNFGKYSIRSWRAGDEKSLAEYANNFKIWLNLRDGFPHPYKIADGRDYIEMFQQQSPETSYAIATDSEVIGGIGLMPSKDIHRFSAELGYWLGEPFWGRGIMTMAVRYLVDWTFDKTEITRIYVEPFSLNFASRRVLEKTGFSHDGTLQRSAFKNGRFIDQELYALLKP